MSDSKIIKIVRKSPICFTISWLASIFLIVSPFFFLIPLFKKGQAGIAIFSGLVFLGLIYGLRTFIRWRGNKVIILEDGLIFIKRRGLLDQYVINIDWQKLYDVHLKIKGLFPVILGLGTLEFKLSSGEILELSNVYKAYKIQQFIINLDAVPSSNNLPDNQEKQIELARQLKDKLGQETFQKISEED